MFEETQKHDSQGNVPIRTLSEWDSERLVYPHTRFKPEFSGRAFECGKSVDLTYWKGKGPDQFLLVPGVDQPPATAFLGVLDTFLSRGSAVSVGLPEVIAAGDYQLPYLTPWEPKSVRPLTLAASFVGFHEPIIIGYSIGGIASLVCANVMRKCVGALVLIDLLPTIGIRTYNAMCKIGDTPLAETLDDARAMFDLDKHADRVLSHAELSCGMFTEHSPICMNVNRYVRKAAYPDVVKTTWNYVEGLPTGLRVLILRPGKGSFVSDESVEKFKILGKHCRVETAIIKSVRGHANVFCGDTAEVQDILGKFIDSL